MSIIYYCGGKLGDFIHVLWVVKQKWIETGEKGIIILTHSHGGDKFSLPLNQTYLELKDIVLHQEYIEDIRLDDNEIIATLSLGLINLNDWRKSKFLSRANWFIILSNIYNITNTNKDRTAWLKFPPTEKAFKDKIVIHQSLQRVVPTFPWESILTNNDCVFVTCNKKEYDSFRYKDIVPCHLAQDLNEMVSIISSAKGFCGNQSAPLAIAIALGKECYCQLYHVDRQSYIGMMSNIYHDHNTPSWLNPLTPI